MEEKKEIELNKAEEVKKETIETAKKFKETVQNVDIKEDTKRTKGFIIELFKNPINKLEEMSKESTKYLNTTIIIKLWGRCL